MNIYSAIMKAADHIEANPQEFNFSSVCIPDACGTPGCALGWIGFFYGSERLKFDLGWPNVQAVGEQVLGLGFHSHAGHPFYARLEKFNPGWMYDAILCAQALRQYAEKYHAADGKDDGLAFKRFLSVALHSPETSSAARSVAGA